MLQVEIWSDVVCPFCYIGKRNFENAVAKAGLADQVKVTYRSFELDPSAEKSQTMPMEELLAKKYGRTIEWAREAGENVAKTAEAAGLQFTKKRVPTNSFDAHRLIHFAAKSGRQSEMNEQILIAYFVNGLDIALPEVLLQAATTAGLAKDEVTKLLSSRDFEKEVREDESQAQQIGIRGVPFFLFNGEAGVSGAQPVEMFVDVLKELSQK